MAAYLLVNRVACVGIPTFYIRDQLFARDHLLSIPFLQPGRQSPDEVR